MPKQFSITANGIQKVGKKAYLTVNGAQRKINKAYLTVNGISRLVFKNDVTLADLAVGSSVFMNVNGAATEFIIVNQGIPSNSTLYDNSCDDTWLLMKNSYDNDSTWFHTAYNDYQQSNVRAKLNDVVFFEFDTGVQNLIKQVKIPYVQGIGSNGVLKVGSDGLPSKLFLLGGYELGWTTSNGTFPVDGAVLDYFKGCAKRDAKRIAYQPNGVQSCYWLRSPMPTYNKKAWTVWDGEPISENVNTYCGVRPALILPRTTVVDNNFNIIA